MSDLKRIGHYEIRAELGRGGMATVYRAYDPRFDREVALKVLPPHFLHDPTFAERFQSEAQLVATLEHPAIIPIYDFGGLDEQPYLVMQLLSGGSLGDRIKKRGRLPPAEAARIISHLAPGLDSAHARGIIHRDIKPDNILFDESDRPFLADFGIARLAEATRTMTIIGTPAYMSPEQWAGDEELDARSDIYSLGAVIFEMLAGNRPYKADTPARLMHKHLAAPVPELRLGRSELASALQTVVDGAMAKDRSRRYPSALSLANALAAAAAGQAPETAPNPLLETAPGTPVARPPFATPPVPGPAPPIAAPTPPSPRRSILPGLAAAGGVVLAAVCLLAFVFFYLPNALAPEASPAPATALLGAAPAVGAEAVDPDGTPKPGQTLAAVTGEPELADSQAPTPLQAEPVAAPGVALLRGHTGSVNAVAFSQNGMLLASGADDGLIRLWDMTTQREAFSLMANRGPVNGLAFGPDGAYLAAVFAGTEGTDGPAALLWAVEENGEAVILAHGVAVLAVAWSPAGNQVATLDADGQISLWQLDDAIPLASWDGQAARSLAYSPDGTLLATAGAGAVRLWRVPDGRPVDLFSGGGAGVTFAPDGTLVASGGTDGIHVWRLAGRAAQPALGETAVRALAFAPDGALVAGALEGSTTLGLWQVSDGANVATYAGHTGRINSVTFAPDGTLLATGSRDQTVRLWAVGAAADPPPGSPNATTVPGAAVTPAPSATPGPGPTLAVPPTLRPANTLTPSPTPRPTRTPPAPYGRSFHILDQGRLEPLTGRAHGASLASTRLLPGILSLLMLALWQVQRAGKREAGPRPWPRPRALVRVLAQLVMGGFLLLWVWVQAFLSR